MDYQHYLNTKTGKFDLKVTDDKGRSIVFPNVERILNKKTKFMYGAIAKLKLEG